MVIIIYMGCVWLFSRTQRCLDIHSPVHSASWYFPLSYLPWDISRGDCVATYNTYSDVEVSDRGLGGIGWGEGGVCSDVGI